MFIWLYLVYVCPHQSCKEIRIENLDCSLTYLIRPRTFRIKQIPFEKCCFKQLNFRCNTCVKFIVASSCEVKTL